MLKMVPKMLCRTRFEWRQLVAKFGSSTSTDLNSSCLCFPQRLHRCRWPLRSSGCNISVVPAQQEKHQTRTVTVKERFVRKENLHKKSESEFVKFESKIPILQNFGKSESERKNKFRKIPHLLITSYHHDLRKIRKTVVIADSLKILLYSHSHHMSSLSSFSGVNSSISWFSHLCIICCCFKRMGDVIRRSEEELSLRRIKRENQ